MPEQIDITQIPGARKMSPLEMNGIQFNKKHTVLTPEVLAAMKQR